MSIVVELVKAMAPVGMAGGRPIFPAPLISCPASAIITMITDFNIFSNIEGLGMNFEPSFFREETRCDFLVTEKRKKIWAVELQMLEKFDQVCKKYQLSYYAYYGTLLGAVRHQGFIPWDDDIDLVMFRDDYEKFQAIAPEEFKEPYFFQNSYTDRLLWPFSKIRDSRTTGAEPQFRSLGASFHQGIFIDIFPFDSVEDGVTPQFSTISQIQNLLWAAITNPEAIVTALENGHQLYLSTNFLLDLLKNEPKQRFKIFESFNLSCFGQSQKVNYIMSEICKEGDNYRSVNKSWFAGTVYLPFEHLRIPAPAEYDKILTQCYGDYRQPIPGGSSHEEIFLDPDTPYRSYFS